MRAALVVAIAMLLTPALQAKEFTPKAGLLTENHSDAKRSADAIYIGTQPDEADTLIRPYVGFDFVEQSGPLNAEIDLLVEHERYLNDTFEADTFFRMDGFIDYEVVPGRMIWAVEDKADRRRIAVNKAATADNYQNFNVLSTGPDLFFSRGVSDIIVKARLSDVFYSNEVTDNQRMTLSAALKRPVSEVSEAGVEAATSYVRFENKSYPDDYTLMTLTARYDRETPWGKAGLRAGYNAFNYEYLDDEAAPMVEGYLKLGDRQSSHSLELSASRKYSDPTLDLFDPLYSRLVSVAGLGEISTDDLGDTGATEAIKSQASYAWKGNRASLRLFTFLRDNQVAGEDAVSTRELAGGVSVGYELRERVSVFAGYYNFQSNFYNSPQPLIPIYVNGVQTGTVYGTALEWVDGNSSNAGLIWHLRDGLQLTVSAGHIEETSNDPLRESTDNNVSLRLDYKALSLN